jgi:hypothetical protein
MKYTAAVAEMGPIMVITPFVAMDTQLTWPVTPVELLTTHETDCC